MELVPRLQQLKLWREGVAPLGRRAADPAEALRELCHRGCLLGGLSVALDLKPDELFGPLIEQLATPPPALRVLDVRERPRAELEVAWGGRAHTLPVDHPRMLVDRLNALLAPEPKVRAVAVLGPWEDMLQLWALPKADLAPLLKEPWFQPENRKQLGSLASGARSR